jgi:serine/threonine protein kinase
MCPDDPTASRSAADGDDPTPAWPAQPATATTGSGDSDPPGATHSAADPSQEFATSVRLLGTGSMVQILGSSSDPEASTLPPTDPSYAPVLPAVPGYDLLEPLGEGGMGVVWKARQVKLNGLVALKMVLGEERAGSKGQIRFLAEAEVGAGAENI